MSDYYSKILWHFTGSPIDIKWDQVAQPLDIIKNSSPKPTEDSLQILIEILKSKILRATCIEKLYGIRETDKFCCVTDIPLIHLYKHKEYYGNVALGFNSNKIYKEFNPVLYIPRHGIINSAVFEEEGFETWTPEQLKTIGIDANTAERSGYELDTNGKYQVPITSIDYKENSILEKYLLNYIKISNFSDEPGRSFYQEREWRRIGDFNFDFGDLSAIIVPESYSEIVIKKISNLKISNISILTWELLEKT